MTPQLCIAIDFDDTFTADPDLWLAFITSAHANGHRVYIVTCRRDTEENRADIKAMTGGLPHYRHIFTGLSAKRWFCEEQKQIKIDIWIDDDPACILNGK